MTTTNNSPAVLSLLGGAAFARVDATHRPVGGITLLEVAVGRGDKDLATFEVTLFRGRVGARQTSGGAVPPAVKVALEAALATRDEVASWR